MRRGKTDANQKEIVELLRKSGVSVVDLSSVKGGCPDLLLGYMKKDYLVEIKNKKGLNKVLDSQQQFHEEWRGQKITVAHTLDDIFKLLNINQKP